MARPRENACLLQSEDLRQYILETNVYHREKECLKKLREATETHPWGSMSVPPEEGQLLSLLLKLVKAKKTMEIGVFTGYSVLVTALALPDDGKIIAIDPDRKAYEIGLPHIEESGVGHKINFIEDKALNVIDELIKKGDEVGTFDFIFIDADKDNYKNYHERALKLVKVGGLIAYDNTLWGGTVAGPIKGPSMSESFARLRELVLDFNKFLAADDRVEISQLCLGDGITLCLRLPTKVPVPVPVPVPIPSVSNGSH